MLLQSNPFGAAKPINAEARLKELDEKIAREKVGKVLCPLSTPMQCTGYKSGSIMRITRYMVFLDSFV